MKIREQQYFSEAWLREIGVKLREARLQCGMSQREVAEVIGAPRQYITRIKSGEYDLKVSTLGRLYSALRLSVDIKTPEVESNQAANAEELAVAALLTFSKSGGTIPPEEETRAVEDAMRVARCNTKIGRTDRQRIEALFLLRDCLTSATREELKRIERAVMQIAEE